VTFGSIRLTLGSITSSVIALISDSTLVSLGILPQRLMVIAGTRRSTFINVIPLYHNTEIEISNNNL
jgi:hypothetical protein